MVIMAIQRTVPSCFGSIPTYLDRHILVLFLLQVFFTKSALCAGEITGFRVESEVCEVRNGRAYVYANHNVDIRLFGRGFNSGSEIAFTVTPADRKANCQDLRTTEIFQIYPDGEETGMAVVNLKLLGSNEFYFFCLRDQNITTGGVAHKQFVHQGNEVWLQVGTTIEPSKSHMLPVWLLIIIVIILLIFSGICSGLNLGLMSLHKTELDIMMNSGTPKEKEYAKIIRPVRRHGNFLLCSILLGNVFINNTMAILLEDLTGSGMVAVASATLGIVIVGEIVPQSICTRYGLAVGAKTIWFTKLLMLLTSPLSYPISRILDCILGEEIGHVYNRDRLRELIHLTERHADLHKEEVNIITGALELSKKNVSDIMTNLEDVFMIDISSVLDFETMNLIMKNGYSRIPVYENDTKNIVGLLNIKDLAFVDPDDRMPLRTVLKFYNHPVIFVLKDTPLDVMLQDFKKGHSHLAVVQRVKSGGIGDPFYEPLGLVTLEDIIEEIIQAEIVDETDVITDNRRRLPRKTFLRDFSAFSQPDNDNYPHLSPQLALAAFQFLSTSVAQFRSELISENVLQKLLRQDIIVNFHLTDPHSSDCFIYTAGKPCDYFVMILQGRVEVEFVKDAIVFEGGPFTFFGIQTLQALSTNSLLDLRTNPAEVARSVASLNASSRRQSVVNFVPDFSVRAVSDLQYMRITRAQYIVATSATLMERRPQSPTGNSLDDKFRIAWQRFQPKNSLEIVASNSNSSLEQNSVLPNFVGNSTVQDKAAERSNVKTAQNYSTSRRSSVSFAAGTQGGVGNGE